MTTEMEAKFCAVRNMQKDISTEILKIPQIIIIDETNVSECRNKKKQKTCWQGPC